MSAYVEPLIGIEFNLAKETGATTADLKWIIHEAPTIAARPRLTGYYLPAANGRVVAYLDDETAAHRDRPSRLRRN